MEPQAEKAQRMQFVIDDMRRDDWETVRAIYREGLATGLAAFMVNPPSWKAWDTGHLTIGRLVARPDDSGDGGGDGGGCGGGGDGAIAGWSALAPVPDT
jgi:hypothetical protein